MYVVQEGQLLPTSLGLLLSSTVEIFFYELNEIKKPLLFGGVHRDTKRYE